MAEPLFRALSAHGYSTPTPIQAQAVPPQIAGRDLLALAETGSGKTAAFVLPILNEIATKRIDPAPRKAVALILAPTRELALQIDAEVAALSRFMNIRRAVVLGGVSKGPQINALKRGVHVLVATPGRLLDHVNARHADLSGVHTLVLDEADRMFDMGFIRDIRKIVSLVPKERRTALLSATMPNEIRSLAHDLLTDPYRVDLSPKSMVVDRIDQKVMIVPASMKQSRLHTILADDACKRVIVFTRTKRGADRVTSRLEMAGIGAEAIHGNKAQNARQRALHGFSAGHVRVLVATDIAARGIDVSDVTHVINFDMPVEPETYVHRIGRTARKGASGIAISLCDPSEKGEIKAIERLMKQTIEVIGDVGGEHLPAFKSERPERDPRAKPAGERGGHRGQRGGRDGEHRAKGHRGQGERRFGDRNRDRSDRIEEAGGYNPHATASHDFAGEPAATNSETRRSEARERPHGQHRHRGPREDRAGSHRGQGGDRPHGTREGAARSHPREGGKPFGNRDRDGGRPHRERDGERSHAPRGDARPQTNRENGDRPHARGPREDARAHTARDGGHGRSQEPRAHRGPGENRHQAPRHQDGPREHHRAGGPKPERREHGHSGRDAHGGASTRGEQGGAGRGHHGAGRGHQDRRRSHEGGHAPARRPDRGTSRQAGDR